MVSCALGFGTVGSLVVTQKFVSNRWARMCSIIGCIGVSGALLKIVWSKSKNNIEEKALAWIALMKHAAENSENSMIYLDDLKNEYRNYCRERIKDGSYFQLYRMLQYDKQLVRKTAHEVNRQEIKALVEGWYQIHEVDAVLAQMRFEIEHEIKSYGDISKALYQDIVSCFNSKISRFSQIIDINMHKKVCKEIKKCDNWVWLKGFKYSIQNLDAIKTLVGFSNSSHEKVCNETISNNILDMPRNGQYLIFD